MKHLPALAGVLMVVSVGLAHGLLTDRWRSSAPVRDAAAALGRVPRAFGEWRGMDLEMDPAQLAVAGAAGHSFRLYENRRTGGAVTVLIVCGRPGPISLHPPEACYSGRGYEVAGPPARRAIRPRPGGPPAEFRVADFSRPDAAAPDHLRILWAWRSAGPWQVPADPRLAFASSPYLYKLYAIRTTATVGQPLEGDACLALLEQLLPELEEALGPGGPPGGLPEGRAVTPRGGGQLTSIAHPR